MSVLVSDELKSIIGNLAEPYWVTTEPFPYRDFCREIVPPDGRNPVFPDGAVGIRVDDDFWAVAALPWECRFYSVQEIVAALWPDIVDPRFCPDGYVQKPNEYPPHCSARRTVE